MSDSKFPRRPLSEKNPYHLGEYREREIIYFCFQYPEWKKRVNTLTVRGGSNEWSDPTGDEAVERTIYAKNMQIVEDACKRVSPEEWELLLKGITDSESSWYNHKLVKGLKCSRDKYYEQKHIAYYYISQKDRV